MISWIQVTFQKHTKLIFLFLLLVMAVPFVVTIGSTPGIGRAGHKVLERPFFGHNLASADDQQRIFGDAELSIYLQIGYMALNQSQLQDYALQRVAALSVATDYGLPEAGKKELTDHIATLHAFQGTDGKFDPKRYADFVDNLKSTSQISRASLARVLSDDVRIAKVQEILSGPGYVLPAEVKSQMERAMTEWTVSVATTAFDAFKPEVPVNEMGLASFFDNNAARYQTPARVSVDYVSFKPGSYVGEVKFTDTDLLAFYKANPSRFATGKDDATAGTDSIPPALHAAVESALRTELASKVAAHNASDFAFAIFDQKIKRGSPSLDDLIAHFKVTREKAPLFAANQPPNDLGWTAAVAQEAFKLGDERFFSDPISLADGSQVVLFWNETLPANTPDLAAVRDAVVRDYTAAERRRMFVEAGARWRAELQAKLSAGVTLEAAAAALNGAKFEVVSYPAFTRRKPPEKIDPAVLSAAEETPAGQLSGFTVSGEKGMLVDVVSKNVPNIDETSPEFAAARTQIAQMSASVSQNLVLSELVQRELSKSPEIER